MNSTSNWQNLNSGSEALSDIQNSVYRTALKLRSVQTLCQLDLTDVSLIQHILPCHQCQKENSLKVQQLCSLLKELFQSARLDKPGQVDPKAPDLTLRLLTAMYDRSETGVIKARSAAGALIALSGDNLLTKYRAFFQFYVDKDQEEALMSRSSLRSLLTDLHQVLNSAVGEEKFLSWLRTEPALLLWLPTCHRLSAAKMVTHNVRCRVCKNFPITGLRYRCLKCLNFDLCQVCFFTGRLSKPHKKSHPVTEHCVQVSAKENAKLFLRTVRNNLFQERCRRKEAQRRKALEMLQGGDLLAPEPVLTSTEPNSSPQPAYCNPASSVDGPGPHSSKQMPQRGSVVQQTENGNRAAEQDKMQAQVIASIKAELLKTHESIKDLHNEKSLHRMVKHQIPSTISTKERSYNHLRVGKNRLEIAYTTWMFSAQGYMTCILEPSLKRLRYLKKQLNNWKDKVQLLHNSQEDTNSKLEAKFQVLMAKHESLRAELQQMRQEIKVLLQPPNHPSFSMGQNMEAKNEDALQEIRLQPASDSILLNTSPGTCGSCKAKDPFSIVQGGQLLQIQDDPVTVNMRLSGDKLRSIPVQHGNPFMGQHEKSREKGIPQACQPGTSQPEMTRILHSEIMPLAPGHAAAQVQFREKEIQEEEELQQLVMKLKDALSFQVQPGKMRWL
ncbi:PREDICTED: dystrotelin [Gavialis gangeticus]|uniref:dystrotelin n=1 Tax=Gavialis gangeticus TaxID=94835 RepID=UPI00092F1A5F|nr:PREDICTED: dystrotelin [Gavialis gangeticus]